MRQPAYRQQRERGPTTCGWSCTAVYVWTLAMVVTTTDEAAITATSLACSSVVVLNALVFYVD